MAEGVRLEARHRPDRRRRKTPLERLVEETVHRFTFEFETLPGGMDFWYTLYDYRKNSGTFFQCTHTSLKAKWSQYFYTTLFPTKFRMMLTKGALLPSGQPCPYNKTLYLWVLNNLYNGDITVLYRTWLTIKDTLP